MRFHERDGRPDPLERRDFQNTVSAPAAPAVRPAPAKKDAAPTSDSVNPCPLFVLRDDAFQAGNESTLRRLTALLS